MSRTPKRGKPPGYEYWSRRPGAYGGGSLGRQQKTNTHRLERRVGEPSDLAEQLRDELHGAPDDPR